MVAGWGKMAPDYLHARQRATKLQPDEAVSGILRFSLLSARTCGTLAIDLNDDFRTDFWTQFPGLVWSNPGAGDSARIRAALLKPRFHVLLAIAVEFGCERLNEEWNILQADPLTDTSGAAPAVNRILKNILRGYQQACS